MVNELRGMHFAWSKAAEQRHNRAALAPAHLDAELAAIAAGPYSAAIDRHELAGTSADYQPDHEGYTALRLSRMLYRHPDIDRVASSRRNNYHRWAAATAHAPNCRLLYLELPEGCIPYMFPLLIENPEPHFYWLKQLGLPIFRWDSIVASACPTASRYRLHLLHLPCHQSLASAELDWMIATLKRPALTPRHKDA